MRSRSLSIRSRYRAVDTIARYRTRGEWTCKWNTLQDAISQKQFLRAVFFPWSPPRLSSAIRATLSVTFRPRHRPGTSQLEGLVTTAPVRWTAHRFRYAETDPATQPMGNSVSGRRTATPAALSSSGRSTTVLNRWVRSER